jgi:hypothetical protein
MSRPRDLPNDELSDISRKHGVIEGFGRAPRLNVSLPVLAEKDLGKAEIEFAAAVTAPLVWVLRDTSGERIKGGSAFFLDTGSETFAVTACHVVEQCFADSKLPTFVQAMIEGRRGRAIPLHLGRGETRVHDGDPCRRSRLAERAVGRDGLRTRVAKGRRISDTEI